MATYLQGQQDYVTQIQPTQPNLQFDAQMLGNLQSKYDAGHKKVSELYGSLLNSAMTRTDNQEARNEFFQMINQDIRRMGSLDFSLQQNVDAAANVFQSIYTNKGIVKDMVWTKNYQTQMSKRDGLKNSTDTEKTGGAWAIGDRAMAYKREEFANATADEALSMSNAEYAPQFNMMKDAIKLAKDAGLNVTVDKMSKNGRYIITTKNGDLITSPLTTLFKETFANDPKYKAMYDTKAYVARNDWTHSAVKKGEFKDLDEAKLGFLEDFKSKQSKQLEKSAEALDVDLDFLDQKVKDERKAFENKEFTANSDRGQQLQEYIQLQNGAASAKEYTDSLIKANKSIDPEASYDVLAANIDAQRSYDYMNKDITGAVRTLAFKDAKQTLTADEFAKIDVNHKNKLSEMSVKFAYDKKLQEQKDKAAMEREQISAGNASIAAQSARNAAMVSMKQLEVDLGEGGKHSEAGQLESILTSNVWAQNSVTGDITKDRVKGWAEGETSDDKHNYAIYLNLKKEEAAKRKKAEIAYAGQFWKGNKGTGYFTTSFDEIPYPELVTKQQLNENLSSSMKDGEAVSTKYVYYLTEKLYGKEYTDGDDAKKEELAGKILTKVKAALKDESIGPLVSLETVITERFKI
jgi:hypothetical protein